MSDVDIRTVQSAWVGRAIGVLQVLGGALEAAGGVGLLLVPEPTFLTKAGGTILVGHSADTLAAGLQSIWSGAVQRTLTQQGAALAARSTGASVQTAERIGTGVDIAAGIGPALATQAARYAAINAAQQATDRVAIAWFSRSLISTGHNAVGVTRSSGRLVWVDLAGDTTIEGGVSFAVRGPLHGGYQVTQLAVPAERAARALQATRQLEAAGAQTWGYLGPNCSTTALKVLQEGGVAVPVWARAPAALLYGVRHGYAVTAVGSGAASGAAAVTAPPSRPRHGATGSW